MFKRKNKDGIMWAVIISGAALMLILMARDADALTNINDCQELTLTNERYVLTADVDRNDVEHCFNITSSGIELDCDNHYVNLDYIDPTFADFDLPFGVYINASNVLVRNYIISNKPHDIFGELTLTGIGIRRVNYYNGITVINNTVENMSQGINIIIGNDTYIQRNHVYNTTDEGIYYANSDDNHNNTILDNLLNWTALDTYCMNGTIQNNVVFRWGGNAMGLTRCTFPQQSQIALSAINNTILCGSPVVITPMSCNQKCVHIGQHNTLLIGGKIIDATNAISIGSDTNNTIIQDVDIINQKTFAICDVNSYPAGGPIRIINVSYPYLNESLVRHNNTLRQWYYDIYINDTHSNPISDVTISAYNVSGNLISTDVSNSTGNARLILTEYVSSTNRSMSYYSNYTVNVSKNGYTYVSPLNSTFNLTDSLMDVFTLSRPPIFNETPTNISVHHNLNLSYQFNCSDPDNDTIHYFVNDSIVSVYENNGSMFDDPTPAEAGRHVLNLTCGDLYLNTSALFNYTILNDAPTVASAAMNNSLPSQDDDLACINGTTADTEGDIIYLFYRWINGSTMTLLNDSWLGAGNTSDGEVWRCAITPFDGTINGTTKYSSSVGIGTTNVAPIINWTNATRQGTDVLSTAATPTNNNTLLNLSVTYYDDNAASKFTAYFCRTDSATTAGCTDSTFCVSEINSTSQTNVSCVYNLTDLPNTLYDYYVYVLDDSGLLSLSLSGSFNVNHPPTTPVMVSPIDGSYVPKNYTIINFSSYDSDSDLVNYSIYLSMDAINYYPAYSGNLSYFNLSGMNETTYYLIASATDENIYSSNINSSVFSFNNDYYPPNITMISLVDNTVLTTESVVFMIDLVDRWPLTTSSCKLTLRKSNYNWGLGIGVPFNESTDMLMPPTVSRTIPASSFNGAGILEWQQASCFDQGGNLVDNTTVSLNITISSPSSISSSGGGSTQQIIQSTIKLENITSQIGYCGDGICSTQRGEDPLTCSKDCVPELLNLENIFCQPIFECGNWKTSWFMNIVFIGLGISLLIFTQQTKRGKTYAA